MMYCSLCESSQTNCVGCSSENLVVEECDFCDETFCSECRACTFCDNCGEMYCDICKFTLHEVKCNGTKRPRTG